MERRRTYKIGNITITEFEDRDEAIAFADAEQSYRELWMMIVEADMNGLLSAN